MKPTDFGPDTSTGLVPYPAAILTYALFFGYGARIRRGQEELDALKHWRVGGALLGIALYLAWKLLPAIQETAFVAAATEAGYAWAWSWSALGMARSWNGEESRAVRWVSDSSYWLYLTHLPLIVVLQGALVGFPAAGWTKAIGIILVVCGVLWVLYAVLVRHGWIGRLLHGPRPY